MITYHHIGGRNGTYPLPLKKGPLLQDFHLILYDADQNCYEQMKSTEHGSWGKVSVYPYCIGGKTEKTLFHLNFHPTTNSLYHFNDKYKDYNLVSNPIYGEYSFGEACKHIQSVNIDLLSLVDALQAAQITDIDFLSLDVQGAEYDILAGAQLLLEENCVGIQLEVEFVKLYQQQKTFADIDNLMSTMGFELLDLGNFGRCAPMSLPIGFRGLEQPLYAEAVYIKSLDKLVNKNNPAILYKAAFFALIYNKLGLCLRYLSKIAEITNIKNYDTNYLYLQCLSEIWLLFKAQEHLKLPKISELFSHERFQNYYGQRKNTEFDHRQVQTKEQLNNILPSIKKLNSIESSLIEELLKKYELYDVIKTIKQTRFVESNCFLQLAE